MDELFTLPQEDLEGIEDAELAATRDSLKQRVAEVVAGRRDPEVVGELSQTEVGDQVQAAVLAIEKIDAELAGREKEDDEYDDKLTSLAEKAGVELSSDEGADEGDGDEDEGDEADEDTTEEATTAAAVETPKPKPSVRRNSALPAARRHKPVATADDIRGLRVTTHAQALGAAFDATEVLDRDRLGLFLADIIRRGRVQPGQSAVLARASYTFPEERMLTDGPDSHLINSSRIKDVVGEQALVASGGNCAPLPPIYELPGVETPARPVRGANPSFQAARGGVQLGVTPKMGDYSGAVGVVTAAENAEGGTFAVKSCMRIECPDFNPVSVDSIYQCIEADNLAARAYPELMSRIADLVLAEQSRLADSKLLTAIKTGSVNTTYGSTAAGTWYMVIGAVLELSAGIRSRNRMPEGARLDALFPAWVIDAILVDQGRALDQDSRAKTRADVVAALDGLGVNVTFYLDGPSTGTGQIFGAQTTGAVVQFPTTIQACIYPTGSWLHLDAGELNLGVVRDSSLNSTNDFQVFAETWENIGFVGVESDWLTITHCPSGTTAAGVDMHTFCS